MRIISLALTALLAATSARADAVADRVADRFLAGLVQDGHAGSMENQQMLRTLRTQAPTPENLTIQQDILAEAREDRRTGDEADAFAADTTHLIAADPDTAPLISRALDGDTNAIDALITRGQTRKGPYLSIATALFITIGDDDRTVTSLRRAVAADPSDEAAALTLLHFDPEFEDDSRTIAILHGPILTNPDLKVQARALNALAAAEGDRTRSEDATTAARLADQLRTASAAAPRDTELAILSAQTDMVATLTHWGATQYFPTLKTFGQMPPDVFPGLLADERRFDDLIAQNPADLGLKLRYAQLLDRTADLLFQAQFGYVPGRRPDMDARAAFARDAARRALTMRQSALYGHADSRRLTALMAQAWLTLAEADAPFDADAGVEDRRQATGLVDAFAQAHPGDVLALAGTVAIRRDIAGTADRLHRDAVRDTALTQAKTIIDALPPEMARHPVLLDERLAVIDAMYMPAVMSKGGRSTLDVLAEAHSVIALPEFDRDGPMKFQIAHAMYAYADELDQTPGQTATAIAVADETLALERAYSRNPNYQSNLSGELLKQAGRKQAAGDTAGALALAREAAARIEDGMKAAPGSFAWQGDRWRAAGRIAELTDSREDWQRAAALGRAAKPIMNFTADDETLLARQTARAAGAQ